MLDKTARTDHPIHPMLASRWSPRAFSVRLIESETIASMFEAARWSPSANNLQPWAFIYAERGTPDFEVFCSFLKETNVLWARNAALLGLALERPAKPDGSPNAHARYDLGQAVARMTFQASALGLHLHQVAGFDAAQASAALCIPPELLPVTAFAIGYLGDASSLPATVQEKELATRSRNPASAFIHPGRWPNHAD